MVPGYKVGGVGNPLTISSRPLLCGVVLTGALGEIRGPLGAVRQSVYWRWSLAWGV